MAYKSGKKCGVYPYLNTAPTVVKQPTKYTGGMNADVKVEKSPTKYTGGSNPSSKFQVDPKS